MKFRSFKFVCVHATLLSAAILGVCVGQPAYAQERAAGGPVDVQMTWSALNSKVDNANIKSDAVNSRIDQVVVCGKSGKVYAPGATGADASGCKAAASPDPATLNINTYTEALCTRGGQHTVVSTCPSGQRLLGCGGGPGDQHEDNEYWVLSPDFKNNRCIGYVGNPACFDNGWSRAIVMASCYRP